jgi:hypothetical protein
MADGAFAYVVAVVGSSDVMSQEELRRLLESLVNRCQDTRHIVLLLPGRDSPNVDWSLPQHWSVHSEPGSNNRVKLDCGLVAQADAVVVHGDSVRWSRLLRLCRDAGIPTRVYQERPKFFPARREYPPEG